MTPGQGAAIHTASGGTRPDPVQQAEHRGLVPSIGGEDDAALVPLYLVTNRCASGIRCASTGQHG